MPLRAVVAWLIGLEEKKVLSPPASREQPLNASAATVGCQRQLLTRQVQTQLQRSSWLRPITGRGESNSGAAVFSVSVHSVILPKKKRKKKLERWKRTHEGQVIQILLH